MNDWSTKCNTTVLRCIAKPVDKVKVMLGPTGFNHSYPIIILSFVADLDLAFNVTAVHEDLAV